MVRSELHKQPRSSELEEIHPQGTWAIAQLRTRDAQFAEICTDYEHIAQIAATTPNEDAVISECLGGLADEIHEAVEQFVLTQTKTTQNQR